ncbi:MAG: hypothetical protein FJ303_26520 [Planctomycetes bacterium]|nr:hypothetical protein [Planctomycetota bacterium]
MDLEAPKFVTDLLPENLKPYALYMLGGAACLGLVILLMIVMAVLRFLFGGSEQKPELPNLEENLDEYPDLKSSTGDRQLRIEGVPVRLRLIVLAPAGSASEIDVDELPEVLDKILPGLGEIYKRDKPRVKVWPTQTSYKGFANFFHRNVQTGSADGEETRWATIAGRVKLGTFQIMLGMALQSIKPNSVGKRTVDSHEWASVLRVRVKD